MQFGGQHPGGIGVPAVGMAFPGYVSQPQLGMGNSEMTWYEKFFLDSVIVMIINLQIFVLFGALAGDLLKHFFTGKHKS